MLHCSKEYFRLDNSLWLRCFLFLCFQFCLHQLILHCSLHITILLVSLTLYLGKGFSMFSFNFFVLSLFFWKLMFRNLSILSFFDQIWFGSCVNICFFFNLGLLLMVQISLCFGSPNNFYCCNLNFDWVIIFSVFYFELPETTSLVIPILDFCCVFLT